MLLNTKVSSAVHELVGGVVEHSSDEEADLPEATSMMCKLYAMNVLSYEGWDPHQELWEEPGSMMAGVYVREPDTPKAPELYVTPAVNEQQYQELLDDMRLLYQGHSRKNGWTGPVAAASAALAALAAPPPALAPPPAATANGDHHGVFSAASSPLHLHHQHQQHQQHHHQQQQQLPSSTPSWEVSVWAEAQQGGDMPAAGRFFKVQATDAMTVRALKRELLQQGLSNNTTSSSSSSEVPATHLTPSTMRIFHGAEQLEDHELLPDHSTILRVLLPGQEDPTAKPTCALTVKLLSGYGCSITECGPWSFVGELRAAIGAQLQTPATALRLIHVGKQLLDDRRLEEYNITADGAVINCVIKVAGGGSSGTVGTAASTPEGSTKGGWP